MTKEELAAALGLHTKYLLGEKDGVPADLHNANLYGAYLVGANLRNANLRNANLRNANLRNANLYGANLAGANLYGADLDGAKVTGVRWPAPTMVLLAWWGPLSSELTRLCMAYDAANHPEPMLFDRWAATEDGPCPYAAADAQRAVHFQECRHLWEPRLARKRVNALALMRALIAEKCDLSV